MPNLGDQRGRTEASVNVTNMRIKRRTSSNSASATFAH
jgi:hypothetical protein